jgi:hypothetical protein
MERERVKLLGGRMAMDHFGWLLCFLWRRLARPMIPTL